MPAMGAAPGEGAGLVVRGAAVGVMRAGRLEEVVLAGRVVVVAGVVGLVLLLLEG